MQRQEQAQQQADHQLIFNRLKARVEQLDRQLDAVLRSAGLSRRDLELVPERVRPADERRFREIFEQIESQLSDEGTTWEELQRPSLSQLSGAFGGRLIRV
jgi:hypothetical protein